MGIEKVQKIMITILPYQKPPFFFIITEKRRFFNHLFFSCVCRVKMALGTKSD